MGYPVLVGQYIGILKIADGDGQEASIAAIRSGVEIVQMDARMAPLLAALDEGLREDAGALYAGADIDLSQLFDNGLAVDLQNPEGLDPSKFRLMPRGTGRGFDDETLDFRLHGTTSVLVTELAYWAWAYGSTCSSTRQTADLVATLHPHATPDGVLEELKTALLSLHRSGCLKIDAALLAK